MRTLEQVKNEVRECEEEIKTLKSRIAELQLERAGLEYSEKYPVGSYLLYHDDKYVVTGYGCDTFSDPVVKARKIKKDGTPGERQHLFRDYWLDNATVL